MFVKLLVLLAAVALGVILWNIFKSVPRKQFEKKNWEEGLDDLTLPELKEKLAEIEELKRQTSTGFVHMSSPQQQKVRAHIVKLNEMSEVIKEKIADRRIGIQS